MRLLAAENGSCGFSRFSWWPGLALD